MWAALVRHDALVEQIVAEHGGHVVARGEGDSCIAIFARAMDADASMLVADAVDPTGAPVGSTALALQLAARASVVAVHLVCLAHAGIKSGILESAVACPGTA